MAEYGLRVISAIFVGIYVARYLGPEQFGTLSYALAIVSIFMAVSRLGMESILVRDIARYPEKSETYMGTAFGLMIIAAIAGMVVLGTLVYFLESDLQIKIYILVMASSLLFQTLLVIDYNFQAQVKAKFSSIAKSIALAISSAVKIYLVWIQADLYAFAIAYAFDNLAIAIVLIAMHLAQKQPGFIFRFNIHLIKPILSSAWPMLLSAVAFMLYSRLDQLMIRYYLDMHQLGVYASALKIFEGWVMIPFIIMVSLIPMITKYKDHKKSEYRLKLVYLFRLFFIVGILFATLATLFSENIILHTFGLQFIEGAPVLVIFMWASIFTTLGTITVRILVIEGLEKKVLKITSTGLLLNIVLNTVLIPQYGISGAAIATLLSLFSAYYLFDYFDHDLKFIFEIKNKAMFDFGN